MLLVWLLRSSERPTSGDVCPAACSGRLADPPPNAPFPAEPPAEPYFWLEDGHGRDAGAGVSIAFDISVLCALQMPKTVTGGATRWKHDALCRALCMALHTVPALNKHMDIQQRPLLALLRPCPAYMCSPEASHSRAQDQCTPAPQASLGRSAPCQARDAAPAGVRSVPPRRGLRVAPQPQAVPYLQPLHLRILRQHLLPQFICQKHRCRSTDSNRPAVIQSGRERQLPSHMQRFNIVRSRVYKGADKDYSIAWASYIQQTRHCHQAGAGALPAPAAAAGAPALCCRRCPRPRQSGSAWECTAEPASPTHSETCRAGAKQLICEACSWCHNAWYLLHLVMCRRKVGLCNSQCRERAVHDMHGNWLRTETYSSVQ